jgi:hypothetical protein
MARRMIHEVILIEKLRAMQPGEAYEADCSYGRASDCARYAEGRFKLEPIIDNGRRKVIITKL